MATKPLAKSERYARFVVSFRHPADVRKHAGASQNSQATSRASVVSLPIDKNGGPFRTRTGTAGLGNLSSILLS
jgi:hypothetical protein